MIKKTLCLSALFLTMALQAQELVKCSPDKTFWLIKEGGKNYAIALPGEVKESNHAKIITVGGKVLQYLVVDKKQHEEKAGSTDDLKVLISFVTGETAYLSGQFTKELQTTMEVIKLKDGRKAIYWGYKMPEGTAKEVEMQHFLNVVEGDKIFGLASTQFTGDNASAIKQLLTDGLNSLAVVKDGKNLCK
ncbi:hypothetical protein HYN59_08935 [Flavobacterium album]|uniref:Uncharacterized protein n=1 Tax=Flavobacterium album TaxID=2175091 RepID=A0A2S1QXX5_9FLAO|nr:hypothetical protein [Flavobacterium album]AWH85234.1 hypothetical protein HYN59_08935 [Flavobacterium album]